jgi:hypothetical protein
MAQIAMIAGLGVMCLSSSVGAALMMGGGKEEGAVCTPEGTKDPNATYKYDADGDCVMTCKTGYTKEDGACVEGEDDDAPTPDLMLDDKKPYAYEAGKLYACTSGKDVGCLWRAEANGIAAAAGMYDPATKTCAKGDHVYCVNDKTVTYAQYADNTNVKTQSGWQNNMHRYKADGARCNKPENAQCQDDQSIASYSGWGGGNTAKITTKVDTRQCVDNAFVYCPDSAI